MTHVVFIICMRFDTRRVGGGGLSLLLCCSSRIDIKPAVSLLRSVFTATLMKRRCNVFFSTSATRIATEPDRAEGSSGCVPFL